MNNNYMSASFYMILCSFSCIASDALSKMTSLDTASLMFARFLISTFILMLVHFYFFKGNMIKIWVERRILKNDDKQSNSENLEQSLFEVLFYKIIEIKKNITQMIFIEEKNEVKKKLANVHRIDLFSFTMFIIMIGQFNFWFVNKNTNIFQIQNLEQRLTSLANIIYISFICNYVIDLLLSLDKQNILNCLIGSFKKFYKKTIYIFIIIISLYLIKNFYNLNMKIFFSWIFSKFFFIDHVSQTGKITKINIIIFVALILILLIYLVLLYLMFFDISQHFITPVFFKKATKQQKIKGFAFMFLSIILLNLKLKNWIFAMLIYICAYIMEVNIGYKNILYLNNIIRGVLLGIGMLFFTNGLKELSLATVILLNFCTPIITVLLSSVFLKENLKHRLPICIINTLGIFISIYPQIKSTNIKAIFSILTASIFFALIDIMNKYILKKEALNSVENQHKVINCEQYIEIKTEDSSNFKNDKKLAKNKKNDYFLLQSEYLEHFHNKKDYATNILDENYINYSSQQNKLSSNQQTLKNYTQIKAYTKEYRSYDQTKNQKEDLLELLIGSSFISSIFFLFLNLFEEKSFPFVSFFDVFYSILIGFLAILIPFFMLKASQKTDLSSLQPLKYIEFPISILASYFLFNESFNLQFFIGFLIIIISTSYSYLQEI